MQWVFYTSKRMRKRMNTAHLTKVRHFCLKTYKSMLHQCKKVQKTVDKPQLGKSNVPPNRFAQSKSFH